MRATSEVESDIVNDVVVKETPEIGPTLDVVPYALSDGYTIDLKTTASLPELLGYSTNGIAGDKVQLPAVVPQIGFRQTSAHLNLSDGQTVVLWKFSGHFFVDGRVLFPEAAKVFTKTINDQVNVQDKAALVFVTVALVDPSRNRIHPEN